MHEPLRCWLTTARSSAALARAALLGAMGAVTLGLSQALHKRIWVRFHRPLHSSNSGANEMLEAGLAKRSQIAPFASIYALLGFWMAADLTV